VSFADSAVQWNDVIHATPIETSWQSLQATRTTAARASCSPLCASVDHSADDRMKIIAVWHGCVTGVLLCLCSRHGLRCTVSTGGLVSRRWLPLSAPDSLQSSLCSASSDHHRIRCWSCAVRPRRTDHRTYGRCATWVVFDVSHSSWVVGAGARCPLLPHAHTSHRCRCMNANKTHSDRVEQNRSEILIISILIYRVLDPLQ